MAVIKTEVKKKIEEKLKSINFELVDIHPFPHHDDYYLFFVLAHNKKKQEYASWEFNLESGETGGLYYGHYFSYKMISSLEGAFSLAVSDYLERIK